VHTIGLNTAHLTHRFPPPQTPLVHFGFSLKLLGHPEFEPHPE